jgi:hypothetical protein
MLWSGSASSAGCSAAAPSPAPVLQHSMARELCYLLIGLAHLPPTPATAADTDGEAHLGMQVAPDNQLLSDERLGSPSMLQAVVQCPG